MNLPDNFVRRMRMHQIIVEALRGIPRNEYEWLFEPVIGQPTSLSEKAQAVSALTDIPLSMATVYYEAIETFQ